MLNGIKFNQQSNPQFASENWKCVCGKIQSQRHLQENCLFVDDLRQIHDLETDEGIVDYFDSVLQRLQEDEGLDY